MGIVVLTALVAGTLLCAFVSYGAVRTVVIDLWDSGSAVESPGEVIDAVLNPQVVADVPTASPEPELVVIPSVTPTPGAVVEATTDTAVAVDVTPLPTMTPTITPTPDPAAAYTWDDPRQVRVLLMGIDQRSATGEQGPFRTDTMILLNMDPVRKTAAVLSFPRDLWVNIPNIGPERINTANRQGDLIAYPGGGGPALAMETISSNFGIKVDYYVVVNFDVFEAVVNALAPNGVEICPTQRIVDDKYPDAGYGTITVTFEPGCQRLDGVRLLQYARTRATQGGDFDRAKRQQEVLNALRAEILTAEGVLNAIGQIGNLWDALSDNYRTNLSLTQIIALAREAAEIESENIRFAVVDNNYIDLGKSPTGDDILLPQYTRISELIQRIFYPQIEEDVADLRQRAQTEAAAVQVFNGTDIAGLAGRTQEWLVGRGVSVSGVGNAPNHNSAPTVIRDYGSNRWTARYLASLLGLPPERIEPGTDGLAADGVVIVVGPDVQPLLSRP